MWSPYRSKVASTSGEWPNFGGRTDDYRLLLSADSPSAGVLYAVIVASNAVLSLWAEPRAPQPPGRVWRDWVLVAVLVTLAVLEAILREELIWRPAAIGIALALVLTLLWRRTNPLAAVAVGFGAVAVVHVATLFNGGEPAEMYTIAVVLVLPYSLFRWGSGREAATGLAIILLTVVFAGIVDGPVVGVEIGVAVVLVPAALGASIRYQASARLSEMNQVKLREREQLARELHDTVAHYVSAIAIQAQAGRTLAPSHPDAATDALELIEDAASRTLSEMRTMVGVLRDSDELGLAPQGGLADIKRLAHDAGDYPPVDVELSGDLDDLRPSVEAAIYRLAQESITNAVRHARRATQIDVRVAGDDDSVRLTVHDDGDAGSTGRSSQGFGLVGMAERAKLLGGTLEAGPGPEAGWTVSAVFPRADA